MTSVKIVKPVMGIFSWIPSPAKTLRLFYYAFFRPVPGNVHERGVTYGNDELQNIGGNYYLPPHAHVIYSVEGYEREDQRIQELTYHG